MGARYTGNDIDKHETTNLKILFFETIIILIAFILMYRMVDLNQKLNQAIENRLKMLLVADSLRQSSDDLTHFARTYTVTGNEEFKKRYFTTLGMRNGTHPRPTPYDAIYWDLDKEIREKKHPLGKKESLQAIMAKLPFAQQELHKLLEAKNNSDELVNLEVEAFHAMEGKYKDTNGSYTILAQPNQQLAINLLHSPSYYHAKSKIMNPIDDFIMMLSTRTEKNIKTIQQSIQTNYYLLLGVLGVFIIGNFFIFRYFSALVVKIAHLNNERIELMNTMDTYVISSEVNNKGIIQDISEAYCKISGYNRHELLGKKYDYLLHPDISQQFIDKVQSVLQNHETWEGELQQLHKNGTSYWTRTVISPACHKKNKECGFTTISYDITDTKKVEELSANLEKKVQERTEDLLKTQKQMETLYRHTRDSIEYASLIQSALIPDNKIFRKYFSDFFVVWHPKDVVGGDIYLFDELRNDDECLLMIIDCTGHGVPGAFVTMLVKAIERQIIARINYSDEVVSPAKILSIFNKSMKHLLKQEDERSVSNAGFDGGILYYNKKEKILRYAGAQTPLFIVKDGIIHTIKGDRHSIGYKKSRNDYEFKEHTIEIQEGMQLYMTTDGYLDQNGGEKGFPFGKKQFQALIDEYKHESMADQQEAFLYTLDLYQGSYERNDDVTVIGLKI